MRLVWEKKNLDTGWQDIRAYSSDELEHLKLHFTRSVVSRRQWLVVEPNLRPRQRFISNNPCSSEMRR